MMTTRLLRGTPAATQSTTPSASGEAVLTPAPAAATGVTPAIFIDIKRCIGCNACSLACKQENNLQIGELWNQVYGVEKGTYPAPDVRVLPMYCQQCREAPCKAKCDSLGYRAITRRSDGILFVDPVLCTGCKLCLPVCPYRAMFFNPEKLNKLGKKGVAEKCHLCKHRIDAGLLPACVITCLAVTREYGDFAALRLKYSDAEPMGGHARMLYGHMGEEPEHDRVTAGYPNAAPCHD